MNWKFCQGDPKGPAKAGDGSSKKDAVGAGSSNQVSKDGVGYYYYYYL